MDAQGPELPRPFHDKANPSFPTVVDQSNSLGQLYGFKAIPNGYLIDESGVIQYKKLGGFDIRRSEIARIVGDWASTSNEIEDASSDTGSLGPEHAEANEYFLRGNDLMRAGDSESAIAEWKKAIEIDPEHWLVRKQIWAAQNPEKFYDGAVDFDWQKVQISEGR